MTVRIHPHAIGRMKERGCTRAEVEYAVRHGSRSPAQFDRTGFKHTFAYNRRWLGKLYRRKSVEAYAVDESPGEGEEDWLVVTVIVKHF